MKKLLLTLALCAIPLAAMAAEIDPVYTKVKGGRCIEWDAIATGDTTASGIWQGGRGTVEVNGTLGDADLEIFYSRTPGSELSIDDDSAPDGLRFSSANGLGVANIDVSAGAFKVNFSSAGTASQDLDVSICSVPQNP